MTIVQRRAPKPSTPIEATALTMVSMSLLPTLNLTTEDPLEEFFNFSVSDFLQLLRRCVSMILGGHNFLELGCSMLLSYLDNIARIGGLERATLYRAHLEALGEQVQLLNTLCQVDVIAIAEIEVARLRVDLMAQQEELRHQEELWSRKLADLRINQDGITVNLEKTVYQVEASQVSISCAQKIIVKA